MKRRLLPTLFFILLGFANASGAIRLRDYENRIRRAVEQVERIKTDPLEYKEQGLEAIRTLVPRFEEIEVEGGAKPFHVDNTWLYLILDLYHAEDDPQQRLALLNEVGGKLSALDEHLLRVEEAAAPKVEPAETRSQLREILSRPDYQPRDESRVGGLIKRAWKSVSDFLSELYQAFVRLLAKLLGTSSDGGWFSQVVIVLTLIGALVGLVWVAMRIRPVRRRAKKRTVLGEEVEEGTSPHDFAEAAMAAARSGDFRTGMRKLYLSLLYELAERNLIEIEENATNHEYLAKVVHITSLVPAMRYLTDRFDNFWYGMMPSTEADFSAYLARYQEAMERAQSLPERAAG
jgi:hypothetical protein